MPILVRRNGEKWERAKDVQFAAEADLQKMLYESPQLVSDEHSALFIREAGLPGSGSTDLLGVDSEGNVLIVEAKLARNQEIRRKVIGQILEYAAYLWTMSYDDFEDLFVAREGHSIAELWESKTGNPLPDGFRETVKANLQSGNFNLFIAVDEMNKELEKIIAYVSSRGAGLKLQALELRTYKLDELEILAPQRHGEFVPPSTRTTPPTITIDQALANCPDDHSRRLFKQAIDSWQALGYEIKPGSVGVAFKADVGGSARSIFWAVRGDLQAAFSEISKNRAPVDALQAFRLAASQIKGFDSSKFLHDQQPTVEFAKLSGVETEKFVQEATKLVQAWRKADQTSEAVSA